LGVRFLAELTVFDQVDRCSSDLSSQVAFTNGDGALAGQKAGSGAKILAVAVLELFAQNVPVSGPAFLIVDKVTDSLLFRGRELSASTELGQNTDIEWSPQEIAQSGNSMRPRQEAFGFGSNLFPQNIELLCPRW
jgi:hypothetical protein